MTAPQNPAPGRYRASRMQKRRAAGTVEDALAELTDAVGAKQAAALLDLSPSQLYRKADPDDRQQLTLAQAGVLTQATGSAALARYLAIRAGCALIPLTPLETDRLAADFAALGAAASRAFGDYSAALAAHDDLDDLDRQALIRDAQAVLDAAGQIIADLSPPYAEEGSASGGGPGYEEEIADV